MRPQFLRFVPNILKDMTKLAGIKGRKVVGVFSIGESHVSQHWDVPGAQNKVKAEANP